MFNTKKTSSPKTSETCKMLQDGFESSIKTSTPFQQAKAKEQLEMLRRSRCRKSLIWIHETFRIYPSPFAQQLAKKALQYAESLL